MSLKYGVVPLILAESTTTAIVWETFNLRKSVDAVRAVAAGNPRFVLACHENRYSKNASNYGT